MQHRDLYPHEILQDVIDKSYAKSQGHLKTLSILSFLGGGYVSFGYMAYLKVVSGIPPEWSGLSTLLGAAVFPICLICILVGGGELATGNMMMMALGRLTKRVSLKKLFRNWIVVSLGNLLGALFMAYFLGHYVGLSEGAASAKTIAIAEAKQTSGRILAIWFPVMIFVLIGLQHFVANMFIIPAGIFAGANVTWSQFFFNMIPVFLGNVMGGAAFVGASYLYAYRHLLKEDYCI